HQVNSSSLTGCGAVGAFGAEMVGEGDRLAVGRRFATGDILRAAASPAPVAAGSGPRLRRRGFRGGRGRTSDSSWARVAASMLPPETTAHLRRPATRRPA